MSTCTRAAAATQRSSGPDPRASSRDGRGWCEPRRRLHAYYLRTSASEQRSWQVPGKHVDFRGDGGYIVLPPSRVTQLDGSQRKYKLIAVAQHQPRPLDAAGLRAFLAAEGARNHGLFWAACRMSEDGHGFDAASTLLGDAACSAGLTEREALTTIRSAYRIATRLGPVNAARPTQAVEAVGL